jgi:enolase-phosphatase E1
VTLRAVLTDIEGTTTALAFVRNTLFPYARARIGSFVAAHGDLPEVAAALAAARQADPGRDALGTLLSWSDADRKIGELKALQGRIWRQGYADGELRGHLWPDAVTGLQRLSSRGLRLAVFSSGSVEAQQLLFRHSIAGDLSALFAGWFDTRIGAKQEPAAYRAIAAELGEAPGSILFLSDVPAELDAALAAGLRTCCLERGEEGPPPAHRHPRATSFDTLPIEC